jgi:hypothetical protein
MRTRNIIRWLWLGLLICLIDAKPAHAFYNPQQGRWLNRDPVEEGGGPNLCAFPGNNPLNEVDPLGKKIHNEWQIVTCKLKECVSIWYHFISSIDPITVPITGVVIGYYVLYQTQFDSDVPIGCSRYAPGTQGPTDLEHYFFRGRIKPNWNEKRHEYWYLTDWSTGEHY